MIREVTAFRACGSGVCGTLPMMAGSRRLCVHPAQETGCRLMLTGSVAVPASLATLLAAFAPLFTAPSYRTFCGLACGFLAQPGKRTVCGMLAGAGPSPLVGHDPGH